MRIKGQESKWKTVPSITLNIMKLKGSRTGTYTSNKKSSASMLRQ